MPPLILRRDLLLLGLAAGSWALGTVVSKRALEELSAVALLPLQLAASVICLALLMRLAGMSLRGSPPVLSRLGILNPGLAYALGLVGLGTISASMAVLLWALEPVLILLLAGLVLREGVTVRLLAGSIAALAGTALVAYDPALGGQLVGVLLTVAGVGCCAMYTILARRWVAASDSTAQVVIAQQAYALGFALVVVVAAAILGAPLATAGVTLGGLLSAVGSGLLYYAAAYWFYLGALRRVPASLASSSFFLIPVFGILAAYALLGERLAAGQWVGVAIVIAGVITILSGSIRAVARVASSA